LKKCFDEDSDVSPALARFETIRRPVIEDYQEAAYNSMVWFENARRYMNLSAAELAYSLMMRSGRVDVEKLRRRDPRFIELYEKEMARGVTRGRAEDKDLPGI